MKRAAAALGLVTILAGVPAALLRTMGPPRIPSFSGGDGLSGSYVPTETVLAALGLIAWAVWAYLALAVLVIIAAEITSFGGREPAPFLSAGVRVTPRVLRGLVEVALGGLMVVTLTRGIDVPDAVHSATATVAIDQARPVSAEHSPNGKAKRETYRVRSGDSLWRIAEQELGSGFRWRRIFELNRGREFSDGRLTNPRWIEPGWMLELPKRDDDRERGLHGKPPGSADEGDPPSPSPPRPAGTEDGHVPAPQVSPPPSPGNATIAPPEEEAHPVSEPDVAEREPEPRPVLRLPSGLLLAGSFASGLLSAHLLGKLRERRSRRLSSLQRPASEPSLIAEIRRAGGSHVSGSLEGALDSLARVWRDRVDEWPPISSAVETGRQVTIFLRGDGVRALPPASGGRVSPLIRFSREGPLVRAQASGPFPTVLRPHATPLQRSLMAPLGYTDDGSAVHCGLLVGGPVSIRGSSAVDLLREMVIAVATHASREDLEVILFGIPPELEEIRGLPQVTGSYGWEEKSLALREIKGEFVRRSRLFLESGVEDIWDHLAHRPDERLPAILVVVTEPPPAARGIVEALAQEAPRVGAGFLALGWETLGSQLHVSVESEERLRTNLPGLDEIHPLLLTHSDARQAIEAIQRAHLEPNVREPIAGVEDETNGKDAGVEENAREVSVGEDSTAARAASRLAQSAKREMRPTEVPTSWGGPGPPSGAVAVHCLGPLEVSRDGHVFRKGWRAKSLELIAYLVANPGGASKDRIIEALWPEIDPHQGSELFYVVTSAIRRRLRTGDDVLPYVEWRGEVYRLQEEQWWIDAWEFETRLKEAERPDAASEAIENLRLAVALYRGEFCAENYYPWAEPARERFRAMLVQASAKLGDLLSAEGEHEEALTVLDRAVEADPVCEDLSRRAMVIEAAIGRRARALERYRKLETTLDAELGVEPDPETQALAHQLKQAHAKAG